MSPSRTVPTTRPSAPPEPRCLAKPALYQLSYVPRSPFSPFARDAGNVADTLRLRHPFGIESSLARDGGGQAFRKRSRVLVDSETANRHVMDAAGHPSLAGFDSLSVPLKSSTSHSSPDAPSTSTSISNRWSRSTHDDGPHAQVPRRIQRDDLPHSVAGAGLRFLGDGSTRRVDDVPHVADALAVGVAGASSEAKA